MSKQKALGFEWGEPESESEDIESIGDWRNIIFIPFHKKWQWLLITTIFLDILLVTYAINYTFGMEASNRVMFLYYIAELLYFIDTTLSVMHRRMSDYSKLQEHLPRNLAALTMDVLTLMPIYEIILLVKKSSSGMSFAMEHREEIYKAKILPRAYRIYSFFSDLRNTAGLNQVVIITIRHIMVFACYSHTIGSVWYRIGCWLCKSKNWTRNLNDHSIKFTNSVDWFFICYCEIANKFAHNSTGLIRGETILERFIVCASMLLGYIFHIMIFNAQLTAAFVKVFKKQFEYNQRLEGILLLMKQWSIPKNVQGQVKNYYEELWKQRKGVPSFPPIFQKLPPSLQKEITLDMFWEAFRHSHVFSSMDVSFKRALSAVMVTELYLPGNYLLRLNDRITKMYFIVSGIVQVLSDEDDESPIISFSAGTIFGEVSGFMNAINGANVRCATYCVVNTLSFCDLFRTLNRGFRSRTRSIMTHIIHRISSAEEMIEISQFNQEIKIVESREKSHIKWIKDQWRSVLELDKKDMRLSHEEVLGEIDVQHTSEFLDLIVLSADVELKMQAICLRGQFPYVMDPDSSAKKAWDHLHLASIVFLSLCGPWLASFQRGMTMSIQLYLMVLELICLTDIIFQFMTAIKVKGTMITSPSQIAIHRCKSLGFLIEAIASIPFHFLGFLFGMSQHAVALLKLNICLKLFKLVSFLQKNEKSLNFNTAHLVLKYIIIYFLTGFWLICFIHAVACFTPECDPNSWYIANMKLEGTYTVSYRLDVTLQMIYYVCSIFLGIGSTDRYQYTKMDTVFAHIMTMIGYFVLSFCFSELCASSVHIIQKKVRYIEQLMNIRKILKHAQITSEVLETKVLDSISFQWQYNDKVEYGNYREIFESCPKDLRREVTMERIIKIFKKTILFQSCDDHFLKCLAQQSVVRLLPEDAYITSAGLMSQNIQLIVKGFVKVQSQMAGDEQRKTVKILTTGDCFGIVEALHNINMFVDASTITVVELCSIRRFTLIELFKAYPEEYDIVKKAMDAHLQYNRNTLLRLGGRLPPMFALEESLGQGDYFTYVIYDNKADTAKEHYLQPFLALGKWSLIRFILLRKAIDPSKRFFIVWEFFRCSCNLVSLLFFYISEILLPYSFVIRRIQMLLSLLSIPDIYIRFHIQYYNENGILVTHPLYTARYYMSTSFAIDAVSAISIFIKDPIDLRGANKIAAVIAIVFLRLLQYYRVMGLLNYYQNDANWRNTKIFIAMRYCILLVYVLLALACITMTLVCDYDLLPNGDVVTHCTELSWLSVSHFKNSNGPLEVYIFSLYIVITNFTGALSGIFPTATSREVIWFLTLFSMGFVLRWYILAKMISLGIVGNTSLITYRGHVSTFIKFMDNETVDESLAVVTVSHFEHVWKRTRGRRLTSILGQLHTHLHRDVAYYMYKDTIKNIGLFRGLDESFFKMFCTHIQQYYYKKDAEIIRCNDVQKNIYIVHKGKVDLLIANFKITTLGNGGAFGNFSKNAFMRQTIKVVAKVHTDLLVIKNSLFQQLINDVPQLKKRMSNVIVMETEFFEPIEIFNTDDNFAHSTETGPVLRHAVNKWWRRVHYSIDHENFYFKIFNYFLCVHITPIASIAIMYMMCIAPTEQATIRYSITYAIDLLFLAKMYIAAHTTYIDPELGVVVVDYSQIFKRYVRGLLTLDIISSVPLELIVWVFISSEHIRRYFIFNRLLRLYYMKRYYKDCQYKLSVNMMLKWVHIVYSLLIFIQALTCIWYISACRDGNHCKYAESIRTDMGHYVHAKTMGDSNMIAYSYVINVYTTTGMRDTGPLTIYQLLVSIIITFSSVFIMGHLTQAVASILIISNFKMCEYEHNVDTLRDYLLIQNVSPILIKTTWSYLTQMWKRQEGEASPALIDLAPSYLQQDIMMGLYGKYIENHVLFAKTHVDFIRQLVCNFKRCMFFPGNVIVEKGDMDGHMYFIHSGEVERYEVMAGNYILLDVITTGASFGEAQGLFLTPHRHTYKAITTVEVVMLFRKDWLYLLDHFPASKEAIEKRAAIDGITKGLHNQKIITY